MGWAIDFKPQVSIIRPNYNPTLSEVNEQIELTDQAIQDKKKRLLIYAVATPNNIVAKNVDPLHEMQYSVEESLEFLREYCVLKYQLELLKEHLENGGEATKE